MKGMTLLLLCSVIISEEKEWKMSEILLEEVEETFCRGAAISLSFFFPYCLMKQGGKSSRGRTAASQSQLFPAMGQKAAPVGSSATFFKVSGAWGEGAWGKGCWAFVSPYLPIPASRPGLAPISAAAL